MPTVTLSPKYQVVIPLSVREALGLKPGEKLVVIAQDGSIEMMPQRDIEALRGMARGIDTSLDRDDDRV